MIKVIRLLLISKASSESSWALMQRCKAPVLGGAAGFGWSTGTHPQGRELWHRRLRGRERRVLDRWCETKDPNPSSPLLHHTVPLRICSRHFSARKQSDVPSFKPWNSPMALLAFSLVENGNVRVNSQGSVPITSLREVSKTEGTHRVSSDVPVRALQSLLHSPEWCLQVPEPCPSPGTWGSSTSTRGEQLHLLG